MADTDRELRQLEDEFPTSWRALHTKMPEQITERLTALARSRALMYAGGQTVLPPVPSGYGDDYEAYPSRRKPPRFKRRPFPGKSAEIRRPRIEPKKDAPAEQRFEAEVRRPPDPALPYSGANDLYRLRGRDRQTWLQRIAELTLQGETTMASYLLAAFTRKFE
jgi:hypothetical protein